VVIYVGRYSVSRSVTIKGPHIFFRRYENTSAVFLGLASKSSTEAWPKCVLARLSFSDQESEP
jgi:hypothetical protein